MKIFTRYKFHQAQLPLQGHRKEKITSVANIGPVQLESGGSWGDASPGNLNFKYFDVPSGAF